MCVFLNVILIKKIILIKSQIQFRQSKPGTCWYKLAIPFYYFLHCFILNRLWKCSLMILLKKGRHLVKHISIPESKSKIAIKEKNDKIFILNTASWGLDENGWERGGIYLRKFNRYSKCNLKHNKTEKKS